MACPAGAMTSWREEPTDDGVTVRFTGIDAEARMAAEAAVLAARFRSRFTGAPPLVVASEILRLVALSAATFLAGMIVFFAVVFDLVRAAGDDGGPRTSTRSTGVEPSTSYGTTAPWFASRARSRPTRTSPPSPSASPRPGASDARGAKGTEACASRRRTNRRPTRARQRSSTRTSTRAKQTRLRSGAGATSEGEVHARSDARP